MAFTWPEAVAKPHLVQCDRPELLCSKIAENLVRGFAVKKLQANVGRVSLLWMVRWYDSKIIQENFRWRESTSWKFCVWRFQLSSKRTEISRSQTVGRSQNTSSRRRLWVHVAMCNQWTKLLLLLCSIDAIVVKFCSGLKIRSRRRASHTYSLARTKADTVSQLFVLNCASVYLFMPAKASSRKNSGSGWGTLRRLRLFKGFHLCQNIYSLGYAL